MSKLEIKFMKTTSGHYYEYDCIQLMYIMCLLYKLGVTEYIAALGLRQHEVYVKLAQDMLDGHLHLFEDPRRGYREEFY